MSQNKFDKSSFALEIENLVWELDVSYMDAILEWCSRNDFELEYASSLVKRNKNILLELEKESIKLHFLKKTIDISENV